MSGTALTDAKLKGMRPPAAGQIEVSDAQVPGLRVRMGTSGVQTFILRKRVGGRIRNITVGRYQPPRFGLADARKKARSIISDIEQGKDPAATVATPRRAAPAALTIRTLWPQYKAAKAGLRSIAEVERVFERYVLPELGDRLADAVTRGDVTRFIDDIAERAPVMARNVHAQLSSFYTWALPRLDRLPANPCRDAGRPPKPKSRDRVFSDAELRALWRVIEQQAEPWRASMKLLVLTGQRREEVFNADRAEFDLERALWVIPADKAKNGVEHLVPLSAAAVELLKAIPVDKESPKLFPAAGNPKTGPSGISKAVKRARAGLEAAMGAPVAHWTLHDIRRTVATGMQRLGIRLEVTEAVLNHVSGSRGGIVGVYQRHNFLEEKRHALHAWAAEVERIVAGEGRGNVVALRG